MRNLFDTRILFRPVEFPKRDIADKQAVARFTGYLIQNNLYLSQCSW